MGSLIDGSKRTKISSVEVAIFLYFAENVTSTRFK